MENVSFYTLELTGFLFSQTKERHKLEALRKKQEQEEERMKKMEEEKRRKQEELKRLTSCSFFSD